MNISFIPLFDDNIEPLSMNNIFEAETFELEPTFENNINEIKANHLKIIISIDMNVSAISLNKNSSYSGHLKSYLMPWILLMSPVKSPQFIKHLSSMHSKGNTQLQILKWWVPLISELYPFFFWSYLFQYLSINSTRFPTNKTLNKKVHFFKKIMLHPSATPISNVK